jgi:outer membrane protein TolC
MTCTPRPLQLSAALAAALWAAGLIPAAASDQQQPEDREIVLDLEQALRLAESNSAELKRLRAQHSLDRERLRLAYRSFLPRLEVAYTQNDSVVYAAPDSRSRRLSLDVEMLLYGGGVRAAERDRQESALRLGEATYAAARDELQLEVTRRFIQILTSHLQQKMLGDSQRSTAQQIAIALEEWRLGEITELDYLSMAVSAKDLEIQRARVQAEERRLLFELTQLAGLPSDQELSIQGSINLDFPGLLDSLDPQAYLAAARRASLELRRRRTELAALEEAARRARFAWIPNLTAEAQLSASGERFPLTEPGFSVGLSLDFQTPVFPGQLGASAAGFGQNQRSLSAAASVAVGENLDSLHAARLARLELQTAAALFQDFLADLEFAIRQQLQEREHQLHTLRLRREQAELQSKRQEVLALMLDLGEVTRAEFVEGETELARLRVELVAAVAELFDLEAALLERCGLPLSRHGLQRIIVPERAP